MCSVELRQYSDEFFQLKFAPSFQFKPTVRILGWSFARLGFLSGSAFKELLAELLEVVVTAALAAQVLY